MRAKLRELRKVSGMTQEMIASLVGISRTHYTQIEAGCKEPSLNVGLKIKRVLSYSRDDIFDDDTA